jgi:hypothetical protein
MSTLNAKAISTSKTMLLSISDFRAVIVKERLEMVVRQGQSPAAKGVGFTR